MQRQNEVINDEWEARCTYFAINILAANIIAIAFTIGLLCTGPFALAGFTFFGMLGNALYNSSEEYKNYKKAKIIVRREKKNGMVLNDVHHQELINKLEQERNQEYSHFWKTLAFNTGGLAFIITALVASWPVAVALIFIYVAYCLNDAYQKQQNKKDNCSHDVYRLFNSENIEDTPLITNRGL